MSARPAAPERPDASQPSRAEQAAADDALLARCAARHAQNVRFLQETNESLSRAWLARRNGGRK